MLRLRFSVGLLFGLLVGVPAGAFIALLAFPRVASDSAGTTSLQVQDLSRKLEAANVDRARVDQQLEQFQKLAEQMTANFNNLEIRFRSLAEERQRDSQAHPAAARALQQGGRAPVQADPVDAAAVRPLRDEAAPEAP